jgi:Tfp pilus assembly protein PilE
MGQQQLLLLVLSVIIVGIAVVIGISMFNDQAASSNLDGVSADLMQLASRAQQYYSRPASMGGGGNAFTGVTLPILTSTPTNENGTYTLGAISAQNMTINGVGKRDGNKNGNPCAANVYVTADSIHLNITDR